MHIIHISNKRSKELWNSFLMKFIYVVGIIQPFMTLPQIIKIWVFKETEGVSLLSWSAYFFFGLFWLFYAISQKERPLTITMVLWLVMYGLVIVGLLLY